MAQSINDYMYAEMIRRQEEAMQRGLGLYVTQDCGQSAQAVKKAPTTAAQITGVVCGQNPYTQPAALHLNPKLLLTRKA